MRRSLVQAISRVITSIGGVFRGQRYYGRYEKMYVRDLKCVPSIQMIAKTAQEMVLDVGCGVGWFSRLLGGYVGIDSNREAIKIAKKRSDHPLIIADASHLPFRSQAFDTCILYDVIEHVKDVNQVLSEVRRVSDSCLISCADFESYYRFFTYDEGHQKLFSPEELREMVKGFFPQVILLRTSGIFMVPSWINDFLARYFPNQIVLLASS